jgi:dipeptidyl aminopeptidase/acylaminoacyl peptidase
MSDGRLQRLLRDAPIPDELQAEERGWRVVRAAFDQRIPSPSRRRPLRWALAIAIALLALAIGLSPAGAKVADLFRQVTGVGGKHAKPALTSLPAPGRVLVTSHDGAWVVSGDGAKRRLGSYSDAAWSPHGLFIAVTRGRELTAVDPDGTVHWSLGSRHRVSDPAWAPSGIRIAYRSGQSLRLVAGNGTDDRLLVAHAAPAAPAWAPERDRNVLAFVGGDGSVRAIDVETGKTVWRSTPIGGAIKSLDWSSNGRLLVVARSFVLVLNDRGQAVAKLPGGRVEAAALSPDGRNVALARRTSAGSELVLWSTGATATSGRRLFAGPGRFSDLSWSPGGSWILLGWRDANQWLFIRPTHRKVEAVSGISRQFAPGTKGQARFPSVVGWCCQR